MRIVRRRHAAICSLERPADRPQGLRRKATAATAQPLPTTVALTGSRSGRNVILRPTTATAAIRSRALTARRPRARTRHRKLTPHQATARAEEAAVVGVAVAAEARTAAEAPPLAGGTNPFSNSMARPDLPGGPFVFHHQLQ